MKIGNLAAVLLTLGPAIASAQGQAPVPVPVNDKPDNPIRGEWAKPIEPFHLVGKIYYVGAANIASYLIVSSAGLILVDTGTREMEPIVRGNIEKLGFKVTDVKILLTSHAHYDHVEGLAAMKKATGAKVMELAQEAPAISSGTDLSALGEIGWDPVPVDRVLKDRELVKLGDVSLRALWTPGHTKGCTTWTTTTKENGRTYSVVIVGGAAANSGIKLLDNARHPTIVEDLARNFRVLKSLKPDIYLIGHPQELFEGKIERLRAGGEKTNPLVDPDGYKKYVAEAEADYLERLQQERAQRAGQKQ